MLSLSAPERSGGSGRGKHFFYKVKLIPTKYGFDFHCLNCGEKAGIGKSYF
jgi:hypothetical protein